MNSRFEIPPGNPPSPRRPVGFVPAPIRGKTVTRPQLVTYLNNQAAAAKHTELTRLKKQLGSGRWPPGFVKAPSIRKTDPYLLILLADQELREGRKEQARYLVEAGYEAYDQQYEPCVYRIHPVG